MLFVEWGWPPNTGDLIKAARYGRWEIVKLLLDCGVPVNIRQRHDKYTQSSPPIIYAILWEREDIFRELRRRGARMEGEVAVKALEDTLDRDLESMTALVIDALAEDCDAFGRSLLVERRRLAPGLCGFPQLDCFQ
jgi:hypothetical protein